MSKAVDEYIERSNNWPDEMRAVRAILRDAGLDEDIKWNKPCYSSGGANIAIMQEMNDFLALMFFKGALMDDPEGVLESQGPNSRSAKRMTFTSVDEVDAHAAVIAAYVDEALRVEAAGLEPEPVELELVPELADRLADDPELKAAFDDLTPGRQRGYNLFIGDAKKAETRMSRIDKYVDHILAGKGIHDR